MARREVRFQYTSVQCTICFDSYNRMILFNGVYCRQKNDSVISVHYSDFDSIKRVILLTVILLSRVHLYSQLILRTMILIANHVPLYPHLSQALPF